MNKRDFVQRIIIRSLPSMDKLEAGVRYAEQLWDGLTALGYGPAKSKGHREVKDHYRALSAYQREWFDKFWDAFAHKHGRNRAALAWAKLGERDKADYQRIVEAARAEALRPRQHGETRKMAEGWLTEKRFEDHVVQRRNTADSAKRSRAILLNSELNALRQFQKENPTDAQARRIEEIEAELKALGASA